MIVISDIHAKNKQPYRKYIKSFFEWLLKNYSNHTVIFLGDLFDSSSPHNEIRAEIMSYIVQFRQVIILTGNHDYSKLKGNVLLPLDIYENISIIDNEQEIVIEDLNCLFLPFKYRDIKEEYESLTGSYSYIFTHITPPQCAFGDEGIQLNLNGVYLHGHTHLQTNFEDKNGRAHYVIGVPIPTRHLEDKQEHMIFEISDTGLQRIDVPKFFSYENIQFGNEPESKNNILNIIDAPSIKSVYDKYGDCYIRRSGITLEKSANFKMGDVENLDFSKNSIKKQFIKYSDENNVQKEIVNTVLSYLD